MAPAKKLSTSKAPKKASSKATTSHPPWTDMIKECIAANPEDARHGVSRPQIKKFVEEKYKVVIGNAQITQLSKAIALGAEKNIFYLPKGLSGRVKLPPKTPKVVDDAKENKPASKTSKTATTKTVAKPATKPGSRTKAVTSKSATTKPASGRKAPSSKTSTAKAVSSTKTVKKQVPTAKATKPAGRTSTTRADSAVKKTYAGKKPTERKVKSSTSKGVTKKAATGASSTTKASRSKTASTKKATSKATSTSRTKSAKRT
ncbi:hypothetical protein V8E53_014625 [Lactarius tabidus]